VKDRGRDAGLDTFDCDIAEVDACEFAANEVDFAEVVDDPAPL
jgi:hypothetical protein